MATFIKPTGMVTLTLLDSEGKVKDKITHHNLVVTTGCELIASQLSDMSIAKPTHMAVGKGTTSPEKQDVQLESEIGRVALNPSVPERSGATVTYTAEFPPKTGTGAVTEVGIFNEGSSGQMLNRAVFPVVNKSATDTLIIQWALTIN